MRFIFILLFGLYCDCVLAKTYTYDPNNPIIGRLKRIHVVPSDDFFSIARKYNVGWYELLLANPNVNPYKMYYAQKLLIPSAHILPPGPKQGIIINQAEFRLYYFHKNTNKVSTFPVSIGRPGWETPLGNTHVTKKRENPNWIPPRSIVKAYKRENIYLDPLIPAGPNNPLGQHAINLNWREYLIHGTNRPLSVGFNNTSGCIRLYPEDVAELYKYVTPNTPVRVINVYEKVAKFNQEKYMEKFIKTQYPRNYKYTGERSEEEVKKQIIGNFLQKQEPYRIYGYPIKIQ